MEEKFLPVGVQDFERMRTGRFVYVDKTRYIHEMTKPDQGLYFLSRPRRFGKSLTVSTRENGTYPSGAAKSLGREGRIASDPIACLSRSRKTAGAMVRARRLSLTYRT